MGARFGRLPEEQLPELEIVEPLLTRTRRKMVSSLNLLLLLLLLLQLLLLLLLLLLLRAVAGWL